ncbi:MAG TPA: GNAT family N-acetyltransferase [Gemmatimonadales bacterium]|nr:GNAT family N-acetyltransferase [Gemmatimonadales bacterium]
MDVQIRVVRSDDVAAAVRLSETAGWNQTAADWERFLRANEEGCFAAVRDDRVVGTLATIVYEGRFGWIGMVVVEPGHRGGGIGTALLEQAIAHLDSRRVATMKLDATPQGRPLYEKLGFVAEYPIERWSLKRQGDRKARETAPRRQLEDVLRLDREVFGADRSGLLQALADDALDFVRVARKDRAVVGYTFGRRGSRADQMGPWMAGGKAIAEALLDEFLGTSERELVFVECLLQNAWSVELVKARGFELSRSLTRMFRGPNRFPGLPGLLGAILGPEFG